jgi:hypothetical protein
MDEARTVFGNKSREELLEELSRFCNLAAITAGAEGLYVSDRTERVRGKVSVEALFKEVKLTNL